MNLRVRLVPTTRTDLQCIACGGFLVRGPRRSMHYAVLSQEGSEDDAHVGLHRECHRNVRPRRAVRQKAAPDGTSSDAGEHGARDWPALATRLREVVS